MYRIFYMSQRHPVQSNHLMFVTTNIRSGRLIFDDPPKARCAIETLYLVQELRPFFLYGFVIMPNHCHFLLRVPEGGSISKVMQVYKRNVSHNIGLGPIWQPRFYLKIVDNHTTVLSYIHRNPVAAGLCKEPESYPWSSASGRWPIIALDEMGHFI